MKIEGRLFKNNIGRYEIVGPEDAYEFTSGDTVEIYEEPNGRWVPGRIEFDHGVKDYYFYLDNCRFKQSYPLDGMLARIRR